MNLYINVIKKKMYSHRQKINSDNRSLRKIITVTGISANVLGYLQQL